jgi:hypothetical protein
MRKLLSTNILDHSIVIDSSTNWNRFHSMGQKKNLDSTNYSQGSSGKVHPRLFSANSRQTVMINNLQQGLSYANKQYENLTHINNYIRQIITLCSNDKIHFENGWSIYLDSIVVLSEEQFSNHIPLFGNGTESPIRVHLIREGIRFINEFPINSLLGDLHFQSLLHSGSQQSPPPEQMLNFCSQEVIQQMLFTDRVIERSSKILNELKEKSVSNNYHLYGGSKKTKSTPSIQLENAKHYFSQFFRRLINA